MTISVSFSTAKETSFTLEDSPRILATFEAYSIAKDIGDPQAKFMASPGEDETGRILVTREQLEQAQARHDPLAERMDVYVRPHILATLEAFRAAKKAGDTRSKFMASPREEETGRILATKRDIELARKNQDPLAERMDVYNAPSTPSKLKEIVQDKIGL